MLTEMSADKTFSKVKKMNVLLNKKILLAVLAMSFSGTALACGNQCYEFGQTGEVILGGGIDTMGQGRSLGNGAGDDIESAAYTFTDGSSNIDINVTLTNDQAEGCTDCGDNRVTLQLGGKQFTAAGAQNNTHTLGGAASSDADATTWSGMQGYAFGGTLATQSPTMP